MVDALNLKELKMIDKLNTLYNFLKRSGNNKESVSILNIIKKVSSSVTKEVMEFDFNEKFKKFADDTLYPKHLEIANIKIQQGRIKESIAYNESLTAVTAGKGNHIKVFMDKDQFIARHDSPPDNKVNYNNIIKIRWEEEDQDRVEAEILAEKKELNLLTSKVWALEGHIKRDIENFYNTEIGPEIDSKYELLKSKLIEQDYFKSKFKTIGGGVFNLKSLAYKDTYVLSHNKHRDSWYNFISTFTWNLVYNHFIEISYHNNQTYWSSTHVSKWPDPMWLISKEIFEINKSVIDSVGNEIVREYNTRNNIDMSYRKIPWAAAIMLNIENINLVAISIILNKINELVREIYQKEVVKYLKTLNLWGATNASNITNMIAFDPALKNDEMVMAIRKMIETKDESNIAQAIDLASSFFGIPEEKDLEKEYIIDTHSLAAELTHDYILRAALEE